MSSGGGGSLNGDSAMEVDDSVAKDDLENVNNEDEAMEEEEEEEEVDDDEDNGEEEDEEAHGKLHR